MDLIPNKKFNHGLRSGTELVQQEKTAKLLASYLVTNGLTLYSYNHITEEIKSVEIKTGDHVVIYRKLDGTLSYYDPERMKCQVDAKDTHFEALNNKTATRRVERWKAGIVKELCNLRVPDKTNKLKNLFNGN